MVCAAPKERRFVNVRQGISCHPVLLSEDRVCHDRVLCMDPAIAENQALVVDRMEEVVEVMRYVLDGEGVAGQGI
jgi:hypothetical protein